MRASCADRIGVTLQKFTKASGPRLFVAPDGSGCIAPIWLGKGLPVFSRKTRERCGQIIAQAHPLLVIVLKREHARIRTILIRKKLAQRIGKFERAGIQRLKSPFAINRSYALDHGLLGMNQPFALVREPARFSSQINRFWRLLFAHVGTSAKSE